MLNAGCDYLTTSATAVIGAFVTICLPTMYMVPGSIFGTNNGLIGRGKWMLAQGTFFAEYWRVLVHEDCTYHGEVALTRLSAIFDL